MATGDSAVERLLFECLERFEAEGEAGVDSALAAAPELADAARKELALLRSAGLLGAPERETLPRTLGDFVLHERLGAGGMGIVYRATQTSLQREVALKLIRPEHALFAASRERFRREVLAVARLQHPGIVPVHSVGEAGGAPYFAMELIDGETLAARLARVADRPLASLTGADLDADGALSWTDACVRLVRSIAEALEHAHGRGVLHRDVKPSNVALTRTGRALLFDFGLASLRGDDGLTRSGSQPGSLPYMSPEQVRGERELDARSDVYSLGLVLFELLTLRAPFASDTSFAQAARSRGPTSAAPSPRAAAPSIARDLDLVCRTALEPDRARRYASAADFARDLGNVLARRPIEARRPSASLRLVRWSQRNPALAAGLAAALVLSLGVTLFELRQQAAHARELTEQRDVARERFDEMRRTATSFLFDFDAAIAELAGATPARRLVVARAQELLEKLAAAAESDLDVRFELASAHVRLGDVLGSPSASSLGDPAGARAQYERGVALYDELIAAERAPAADRYNRALARRQLANLERYAGQTAAAFAHLEAARADVAWIVAERPDMAREAEDLAAHCDTDLAYLHSDVDDLARCREHAERATAHFERRAESATDPRKAALDLLDARRALALALRRLEDWEGADREHAKTRELAERALAAGVGRSYLEPILWSSEYAYAETLCTRGENELAAARLRETCATIAARVERESADALLARMLVDGRLGLGMALLECDAFDEAREVLAENVRFARATLELGWDAPLSGDLRDSLHLLANVELNLVNLPAAGAACVEALARREAELAGGVDTTANASARAWCEELWRELIAEIDAGAELRAVIDELARQETWAAEGCRSVALTAARLDLARSEALRGRPEDARRELAAASASFDEARRVLPASAALSELEKRIERVTRECE